MKSLLNEDGIFRFVVSVCEYMYQVVFAPEECTGMYKSIWTVILVCKN